MRLIWTVDNEKQLLTFYYFLLTKGIEGHIELVAKDGDAEPTGTLWVVDEDEVRLAKQWLDEYLKDPQHPQFQGAHLEGQAIETAKARAEADAAAIVERIETQAKAKQPPKLGTYTFILGVLSIALFTMFLMESFNIANIPPGETYRLYWFDYPARQELKDQRILKFGVPKSDRVADLSDEALELYTQELRTPQWQGVYTHVLRYFKGQNGQQLWRKEPLFEKLQQGEVWRLVTPIILHGSLLHIFFNMIWLFVLGAQMERRLGGLRYLLFILLTAVLSNTAQYLMSGWTFLGFSGVICGMLGFVWVRQKRAPWEGYQLAPGTIAFISVFVGALALLQLASFVTEIFYNKSFSPYIANTCHIAGGLVGVLLARFKFFHLQD